MHATKLPPVSSIIFGTFKVLDVHIADKPSHQKTAGGTEAVSYVDLGFGSDEAWFAGAHRFSVSRSVCDTSTRGARDSREELSGTGTAQQDGCETLVIGFHGMTCNPQKNRPKGMFERLLFKFHLVYADLLFRESVGELVKFLGRR